MNLLHKSLTTFHIGCINLIATNNHLPIKKTFVTTDRTHIHLQKHYFSACSKPNLSLRARDQGILPAIGLNVKNIKCAAIRYMYISHM